MRDSRWCRSAHAALVTTLVAVAIPLVSVLPAQADAPTGLAFLPLSGSVGTSVTIMGVGFDDGGPVTRRCLPWNHRDVLCGIGLDDHRNGAGGRHLGHDRGHRRPNPRWMVSSGATPIAFTVNLLVAAPVAPSSLVTVPVVTPCDAPADPVTPLPAIRRCGVAL
jgi:hypothetical protein